jgi:MFS family permease
VVSLGFPLGEGILPLLIVWLIHEAGWRNSWLIIAGYSALVVVPLVNRLLRETKWKDAEPRSPGSSLTINTGWSRREVLRDPRFYLLLPIVLTLPFVLTGLFLFQVPLAQSKGWSTAIMATAFAGFALGRIGSSLLSGPLIDRLGAVRLLPACLVPLAFGVAGLAFMSQTWVPIACFFLAGVSQGLSGTIKSAVHAEMYGVGQLGTIRSLIAAVMVLGTALSPALFGWLFDRGVPFEVVSYMILLLIGIATTSAWLVSVRTPEDRYSIRREAGTPREAS